MRLTNLEAVAVAVSALAGASGTATLTFTATDYATATVTVEIMDAPTQPELPVGLVVVPGVLEIVTGESRQISITVETTATITIAGDGESARVAWPAEFTLLDGAENSTQIDVIRGSERHNDADDYRGGGRLYQRDGERAGRGSREFTDSREAA